MVIMGVGFLCKQIYLNGYIIFLKFNRLLVNVGGLFKIPAKKLSCTENKSVFMILLSM